MLQSLFFLLVGLALSSSALVALKEVNPAIYSDLTYSSCVSQGFHYYDSLDESCKNCDASAFLVSDASSDNGYPCKCAPGYKKTEMSCANDSTGNCARFTCTACAGGTPAYTDGSACTSCDGSTSASMGTDPLDCECPVGSMLVESDASGAKLVAKECLACPAGTQVILTDMIIAGKEYTANAYSCQACPGAHMSMDSSFACTCDATYTVTGVSTVGATTCVLSDEVAEFASVEDNASLVRYSPELSLSSLTVKHYYAKAAAECKYFGGASDIRACQTLANLCVLHLYDTSFGPCKTFQDIGLNRIGTTNEVLNWDSAMPWLFMSSTAACFNKDYHTQVSLDTQYLRYIVGSYTLNGTFTGFQPLENLFSYCSRKAPYSGQGSGDGSSNRWQIFGATEQEQYKCDLDLMLDREQLFYELYLYDPAAADGTASGYLPVPVRVVNTTRDGGSTYLNALHPQPLCALTDVLVRRFTLMDTVSGVSTTSTNGVPSIIRYAADITMEVSLSKENYGIFAPVLSIAYEIAQPGLWPDESESIGDSGILDTALTSRTVTYDFSGRYTSDITEFQDIFSGWAIACSVFCGLYALYSFNMWITRHSRMNAPGSLQNAGFSIETLTELALRGMQSWVYFFFPISTLICWYFFTFFKLQGVPSTLLPPTDDIFASTSPYYTFTLNIVMMFFFQLACIIVMVYRQCNTDIFFLDWEPATGPEDKQRVSVWRTIFVANEWAEMATMRKIDIRMNLFLLGLILIGCGQDYAATQQPDVGDLTPGKTNAILRFANTTFWWLLLSACQWLWKFLIYERFFAETMEQQFVDFCTIAKVSMVIIDEPFHGYYLHCRSPHQHADGTMQELIDMLHKEEAGLTVDRSLTDGPPDVQSFQMFISAEWKASFNKIYNRMARTQSVSELMHAGRKQRGFGASNARGSAPNRAMSPRGEGAGAAQLPNDRSLKAWRELTVFLQEFVENNFGKAGLRRMIREPTYWENMVDIPPDLNVPEQPSVFFPDRSYNYTKALFLGREPELLLFNICTYSAFDLWTESTAISIVVTYAFDWVLVFMRDSYGAAQISSKTMIDERFLL